MKMMTMTKHHPLHLEAEPEPAPLYAFLYFVNGKRLQIVGEKGEIATLNFSNADDYGYTFCALLSALCREYGRIFIRKEHLDRLPVCVHPYFEPAPEKTAGGDER
jgi:hypothetical protein